MPDIEKFIQAREATREQRRDGAFEEGGLGGRNWFMFSEQVDPGVKERDLFDFVDMMVLDTLRAWASEGEIEKGFDRLDQMHEKFQE